MVTKLLGIGIIAGEEMGELWRWIGKTWELNLAIHAAFAKLVLFNLDMVRHSFHQCNAPQGEHGISIAPKLETGQSLLKG